MEINIQNSKPGKIRFKDLVTRWLVNSLGLVLLARFLDGISLDAGGFEGLIIVLVTSAVLVLINTGIKPVLLILTLPITLLTLGLFALLINGAMLSLASVIVPGFHVNGFWAAIAGALLLSIFNTLFGGALQGSFKVTVHKDEGGKDA